MWELGRVPIPSALEEYMYRVSRSLLAISLLIVAPKVGATQDRHHDEHQVEPSETAALLPAERLLGSISQEELRVLAAEVLEDNPALAAAQAEARAAALRAPQVKALPDPTLGVVVFAETPETRVGPQEWTLMLSQSFPWGGKLSLKQEAALLRAASLEAVVEAKRLELITEVRRLAYELAFLDRREEITRDLRGHLLQHEEIARVRYSTGVGLGQGVVKLQAEITRVEEQLLDIETRRSALEAQINSLRDRPASSPLPRLDLPPVAAVRVEPEELTERALAFRPELASAEAEIARATALAELAGKDRRPDFKVGLSYTGVGRREDPAGIAMPPEDNGKDIFAVQGGITLPISRKKLRAGEEEAEELVLAAQQSRRATATAITGSLGDLMERLPLTWRQLRLLEDLLILQAEEAVESAEAGYVAGTLNALDLLDAEHVLFESRIAVARAHADYSIALARLEGAVGEPLAANDIEE
ncbi:MAG: TolC family protein [Acidobacteria bacterium]|nr:MAG: TolC family protein [Acidobacteriota bacterium]